MNSFKFHRLVQNRAMEVFVKLLTIFRKKLRVWYIRVGPEYTCLSFHNSMLFLSYGGQFWLVIYITIASFSTLK